MVERLQISASAPTTNGASEEGARRPADSGAAASAITPSPIASPMRKIAPSIQPVSRERVGDSDAGRIGPRRSRGDSAGGNGGAAAGSRTAGRTRAGGEDVSAWDG